MPKNKRKSKKLYLVIGIIILVIVGVIVTRAILNRNQPSQFLPILTVTEGVIQESLELSGNVQTSYLTPVNTKANGIITRVYVQNGQYVRAGEKMFEIELSPESQQAAQNAYNNLVNAQISLKTAQANEWTSQAQQFTANQAFVDFMDDDDVELKDKEEGTAAYISKYNTWKAAEAQYVISREQIELSQKRLTASQQDYSQYAATVTAPTSGEVMGIAVTEGLMVSNTDVNSQRLAVVKGGNTLVVGIEVGEMDIGKLKVGQSANITLSSIKGQVFQGEIISIDQVGTLGSNGAVYPVLISFEADQSLVILPNMSAKVEIITKQIANALLVPSIAITSRGDQSLVTVVTGGDEKNPITEERIITIGETDASNTQVLSGLNLGDRVQMTDWRDLVGGPDNPLMMMGPGGARMTTGSGAGGGNNVQRGNGTNNQGGGGQPTVIQRGP
ncbi:efflux RND transporter periplasmic adaptor subunit [Microgenomates group bacterium]|nr:efflux RND transporter periplasmic adaptor subunit [Microgenomates group bacterium]